VSFGLDALKRAKDDTRTGQLFFQNYKMELSEADAPSPTSSMSKLQLTPRPGSKNVAAANGTELPLIDVISKTLRYVKEQALAHASRSLPTALCAEDVQWVLTVPAIWRDPSKGVMRKAACKAGIIEDEASRRLLIALEPECAAIAADVNNLAREGDTFAVIDCGGGTVDITVHRREHGGGALCLHEVVAPCGGAWGSTIVDAQFDAFICSFVGNPAAYSAFKKTTFWVELLEGWESTKLAYGPGEEAHIKFGDTLLSGDTNVDAIDALDLRERVNAHNLCADKDHQLRLRGRSTLILPAAIVADFFAAALDPIADKMKQVLQQHSIKQAFLVGGFAESRLLQLVAEHVASSSAKVMLTIPVKPGLAVLRGAVMFGQHPEVFCSRKARFTYGYDSANHYDKDNPMHQLPGAKTELIEQPDGTQLKNVMKVFHRLVPIGEDLPTGHTAESTHLHALYKDQKAVTMRIFATEQSNANFVDDPGVRQIGSVVVPCDRMKNENVLLKLEFGATEIIALATNVNTGASERVTVAYDS